MSPTTATVLKYRRYVGLGMHTERKEVKGKDKM